MTSRVALGIDGCPAGWVVVRLCDGAVDDVEVVEQLSAGLEDPHDSVGVDMPIGLLDTAREADVAARRVLPGRASSVFSAPPAAVVDAVRNGEIHDHAAASALAARITGKGISQQTWRLVPRIIEIDALVAEGAVLLEVHPEVAFAFVVGDVLPRKRTWAGFTTRRAVLERLGLVLPDRFVGDELAGPDDVLDAAVCAWVADGAASGEPLVGLPDRPRQHVAGRPVVIHARAAPVVEPGPRRG